MGISVVQGLFIYKDDLYLVKDYNSMDFYKFHNEYKNIEEEALKENIQSEFGEIRNILFKFAYEVRNNVSTYLIELEKIQQDKLLKIDSKKFYELDNYQKVYIIQASVELESRGINNEIINELKCNDEYKRLLFKNKDYFTTVKKNILKDKIDYSEKSKVGRLLIISIISAFLFQYMFVSQYLGVSVCIYTLVIICGSLIVTKKEMRYFNSKFYFLISISIIFSLFFCIYSNSVFMLCNIILIIIALNSALLIGKHNYKIDELLIIKAVEIMFVSFENLGRITKLFLKQVRKEEKRKKVKENKKYIIQGLIILAGLLVVIVPLLMSADEIFKQKIINLSNLFDYQLDSDSIFRVFVFGVIFVYNTVFIWSLKYEYIIEVKNKERKSIFKYETIIIVLIGLNIIYFLFSIIQVSYLYGGSRGILSNGMIYSSYARQGFFELVMVTIINLALILTVKLLTENLSSNRNRIINVLYSLIIIFTYNMLFSAFYRMILYVEAFAYTRLRVIVLFAIIILAIILFIIFLSLWIESVPMKKLIILVTILMYMGLNIFNMDSFIVRRNIEIYNKSGVLDKEYIKTLVYDGTAELDKLIKDEKINYASKEDRDEIKEIIKEVKSRYSKEYDRWFEFNVSKQRILR